MSLFDDNQSVVDDNHPTNRALVIDTDLGPVIEGLEQLSRIPDCDLQNTIASLIEKVPESVKDDLRELHQRDNANLIKIGLNGLIRRLASEGADQIRMAAFEKCMTILRDVTPAMASFSSGQ